MVKSDKSKKSSKGKRDDAITIKNEPSPKLKTAVGRLEIEDYETLIQLVDGEQRKHKTMSGQWSNMAELKQKLEKKIVAIKKRMEKAMLGPKAKKPIKWFCMTCNKEHDHLERKLLCPECGSEDVKRLDEYLAEQKAVAT